MSGNSQSEGAIDLIVPILERIEAFQAEGVAIHREIRGFLELLTQHQGRQVVAMETVVQFAVEAKASRPPSTIELVDRAIGVLHRVGYNRRRVAQEIGVPESTMRGKQWAPFNKVLKDAQSMQRGLDVARMRHGSPEEEGEE